MTCYSIEPRMRKYVEGYGFLSFTRNLSNEYGEKILDTATKIRLDPAKNCFQKAAATGELVGHRIAEKIVKPKPLSDVNSRNVEQEQRQVFL